MVIRWMQRFSIVKIDFVRLHNLIPQNKVGSFSRARMALYA